MASRENIWATVYSKTITHSVFSVCLVRFFVFCEAWSLTLLLSVFILICLHRQDDLSLC